MYCTLTEAFRDIYFFRIGEKTLSQISYSQLFSSLNLKLSVNYSN